MTPSETEESIFARLLQTFAILDTSPRLLALMHGLMTILDTYNLPTHTLANAIVDNLPHIRNADALPARYLRTLAIDPRHGLMALLLTPKSQPELHAGFVETARHALVLLNNEELVESDWETSDLTDQIYSALIYRQKITFHTLHTAYSMLRFLTARDPFLSFGGQFSPSYEIIHKLATANGRHALEEALDAVVLSVNESQTHHGTANVAIKDNAATERAAFIQTLEWAGVLFAEMLAADSAIN